MTCKRYKLNSKPFWTSSSLFFLIVSHVREMFVSNMCISANILLLEVYRKVDLWKNSLPHLFYFNFYYYICIFISTVLYKWLVLMRRSYRNHKRLTMTGSLKAGIKQSHIRATKKWKPQQNKGYPEIHNTLCREPFSSAYLELRYRKM